MSSMGERFLLYRLRSLDGNEQEKMARKVTDDSARRDIRKQSLGEAVRRFFADDLRSAADFSNQDMESLNSLGALATFVARSRSPVTRNSYTREVEIVHAPEEPARLMAQLLRLEAGLSVIGVPADWTQFIVKKVAMDCISPIRYRVIQALATGGSEGSDLKSLVQATQHPKTTTWRAVDDLRAIRPRLPFASDSRDPVPLDDDLRVANRRAAVAIDERPAVNHEDRWLHALRSQRVP
jgi:hypothetical protein